MPENIHQHTASFANRACCRFFRKKRREQEKSVIDEEFDGSPLLGTGGILPD
jgi:hypothetical protein